MPVYLRTDLSIQDIISIIKEKMHLVERDTNRLTKFTIAAVALILFIGFLATSFGFFNKDDADNEVTFLDLNYLMKKNFQINLRDLKYLIPEAYLYQQDKILHKAISCQQLTSSTTTNSKFTQCSCNQLCEITGDCCYDYWFYMKKNDDRTILNQLQLDTRVNLIRQSNGLYNSCGILSYDTNKNIDDVSIKLISKCAKNQNIHPYKHEFDELSWKMTLTTGKYNTIYEKLCQDDIHAENYGQYVKLKSIVQDTKTHLFYKNYFCARCNAINHTQVRILDTKVKCPLEYDLELKRKNLSLDFHTLFYDSPECVVTHVINENEQLRYRKCNDYDKILIGSVNEQDEATGKSRFLNELQLASKSLFKPVTTFLGIETNPDEDEDGPVKDKNYLQLEQFYLNLCNFYLLPVNVKIISYERRFMTRGNFRNLYCYKAWLISNANIFIDNLNELENVLNNNYTQWTHENHLYKMVISKFDVLAHLNENKQIKKNLQNVDIRQLMSEYGGLSAKLHEINETYQLLAMTKRRFNRELKIVEDLKKEDFKQITQQINDNNNNNTIIKYFAREQLLNENTNAIAYNYTIKINMIFLSKLKILAKQQQQHKHEHPSPYGGGFVVKEKHEHHYHEHYNEQEMLNLQDLTDDERFFLFKTIISENYVHRVIERFSLKKLLFCKYDVNMNYLPSKSPNDYRFNVDIYLKIQFNDIKNAYMLNERVKYLQVLIENLMNKRDLEFFRQYTEAFVKKIELINYFQMQNEYLNQFDENFLQCYQNDYELNSIEQFRVDYTMFVEKNLMTYIDVPSQLVQSKLGGFNLSTIDTYEDDKFKMLFILNENNQTNYRYSIVYDSTQFKLNRKILLKFCNINTNTLKKYIRKNFTEKFQCNFDNDKSLHLIKVNIENFKTITYKVYNDSYLTLTKSNINLTITIDKQNFAVFEKKFVLICANEQEDDYYQDLFRLNYNLNADDIMFNFWFDDEQINEIMENIAVITSWDNIFWASVTLVLAAILTYLHVKY